MHERDYDLYFDVQYTVIIILYQYELKDDILNIDKGNVWVIFA